MTAVVTAFAASLLAAVNLSLKSASDYRYVDIATSIDIQGAGMVTNENGMILRGEDVAFLTEAAEERHDFITPASTNRPTVSAEIRRTAGKGFSINDRSFTSSGFYSVNALEWPAEKMEVIEEAQCDLQYWYERFSSNISNRQYYVYFPDIGYKSGRALSGIEIEEAYQPLTGDDFDGLQIGYVNLQAPEVIVRRDYKFCYLDPRFDDEGWVVDQGASYEYSTWVTTNQFSGWYWFDKTRRSIRPVYFNENKTYALGTLDDAESVDISSFIDTNSVVYTRYTTEMAVSNLFDAVESGDLDVPMFAQVCLCLRIEAGEEAHFSPSTNDWVVMNTTNDYRMIACYDRISSVSRSGDGNYILTGSLSFEYMVNLAASRWIEWVQATPPPPDFPPVVQEYAGNAQDSTRVRYMELLQIVDERGRTTPFVYNVQ